MSSSTLKYYIIPGIIFVVIVIISIIVLSVKKSSPIPINSSPPVPTQTTTSSESIIPTSSLPIQDFTGAVATQELPREMKALGEQKTALRRLAPLSLDFATIEFDYENDTFLVRILDPVEENRVQFASWRLQNYPALLENQFIIN